MYPSEYIEITKLADIDDYRLAETSDGFVIPGASALASISPPKPTRYIALLQYVKDEPRANHYHLQKTEYLIILNGKLRCIFFLPDKKEDALEVIVEAGNMIKISPGCAHRFTALEGPASILELSPQKLDLSDQIQI